MWIDDNGKRKFNGGHSDYKKVNLLASTCHSFTLDDEDEIVDDEKISCYNCLYRRWSSDSFFCMCSVS